MTRPIVACPRCGKPAVFGPENPFRPFCCERCRLIDLGAWAEESYRIPAQSPPDGALGDEIFGEGTGGKGRRED